MNFKLPWAVLYSLTLQNSKFLQFHDRVAHSYHASLCVAVFDIE